MQDQFPPDIRPYLEGRSNFVLKPTQLYGSRFVVVVIEGVAVFGVRTEDANVSRAHVGERLSVDYVQELVLRSWNASRRHAWDTQAAFAIRPGILIEEPIWSATESQEDNNLFGPVRVDELACTVVWGRTLVIEWRVNTYGSLLYELRREGDSLRWEMVNRWAATHPPDPLPEQAMFMCLNSTAAIAERVADCARFDLIRVDILLSLDRREMFVSEVSAWPGTPYPSEQRATIEQRWRYGYGYNP